MTIVINLDEVRKSFQQNSLELTADDIAEICESLECAIIDEAQILMAYDRERLRKTIDVLTGMLEW